MTKWKKINQTTYSSSLELIAALYGKPFVPHPDHGMIAIESSKEGDTAHKPLVRSSWDGQPKKTSVSAPIRPRWRK